MQPSAFVSSNIFSSSYQPWAAFQNKACTREASARNIKRDNWTQSENSDLRVTMAHLFIIRSSRLTQCPPHPQRNGTQQFQLAPNYHSSRSTCSTGCSDKLVGNTNANRRKDETSFSQ